MGSTSWGTKSGKHPVMATWTATLEIFISGTWASSKSSGAGQRDVTAENLSHSGCGSQDDPQDPA
jgi:hypothetical protein